MKNAPSTNWKETPRYFRNPETGCYRRVAYRRVEIQYHVGGHGPVARTRFQVWNPKFATWQEAAEAAKPGERFGLVLTEAQFEAYTYPAEDLPPMARAWARRMLTARPGRETVCRFVKRTTGELRVMRFRYDPQSAMCGRYGFDPKAKGLLPVYDVEKNARRFINLDGVRTVDEASTATG